MDHTRRNIYLTVFGVCVFMSTVVGLFVHRMLEPKILNREQLQAAGVYVFDPPRPIAPFQLVDVDGKPFTAADFSGHWSLIYFGYTHCPEVCSATLSALAQLDDRLQHTRYGPDTRVYLVSVDPKRDTVPILKAYLRSFDPSFTGVRGDLDAIRTFAFNVNVAFSRLAGGNGSYTVAHTPNLVLVNPAGQYQGFFKPPFSPKMLELYYVSARSH